VSRGCGKRWRAPVPSSTISTRAPQELEVLGGQPIERCDAASRRPGSGSTITLESCRSPFTIT
jgi:hypothetical protein